MGLCWNLGRAYSLRLSFSCINLGTQFAEISNLHTHLTLRNLRPANTRKRAIPYGYGFSLVSCPNYFFEAVAWGVICVMTGSVAGTSFAACSLCSSPLSSLDVLYAVHFLLPCSAIAQLETNSLMVLVVPSIRVHRPGCWTDGALGY